MQDLNLPSLLSAAGKPAIPRKGGIVERASTSSAFRSVVFAPHALFAYEHVGLRINRRTADLSHPRTGPSNSQRFVFYSCLSAGPPSPLNDVTGSDRRDDFSSC